VRTPGRSSVTLKKNRSAETADVAASELIRSPCVFVGNNEYQLRLPGLGRRERLWAPLIVIVGGAAISCRRGARTKCPRERGRARW
jgi:hypothetical protein